jgi:hypothetical protein
MASPGILNTNLSLDTNAYALSDFVRLSSVVSDFKPKELIWCISFIKSSDLSSRQIADIVFGWNSSEEKKTLPATIKSKVSYIADKFKKIGYEPLVIYIDIIKRSPLDSAQIIRLLHDNKTAGVIGGDSG